jgi:hypothetical protein
MAGTDAAKSEAMAKGKSLVRIRLFILDRPLGSQRKVFYCGVQNATLPGARQVQHRSRMETPVVDLPNSPRG